MEGSRLKTLQDPFFPMKLLLVAVLYGALGWLALHYFSINGLIGVFWPANGLALAVLLLGGRRYAWGILLGAALSNLLAGINPVAAFGGAAGASLAALLGHWLLTRDEQFDITLASMRDYSRLVLQAAFLSSGVSALVGTVSFVAFGTLAPQNIGQHLLHWWLGDALGVMLVAPLLLVWQRRPDHVPNPRRWPEVGLMLILTFLAGQIIFLDWFADSFGLLINQGYWMFLFITWAAVRLGVHGVVLMLCLASAQVSLGIHLNVGWFVQRMAPQIQSLNSGFYLMILSLVGMSLAIYFAARKQAEASLRIAATAFECQEGMIITDADMRILRTNHSFSRIMGYSNEEVVGQTTTFMRADRQPASFYEAAWATARREGSWRDEVWHRRKNGEVFPQWLTCTAVTNERGDITNYVVTHTDITHLKQQEAKRLADEAAHREALVREVHHRIKNNLQGITGLLRQFAQAYPETADPINQAIGQVRSVAVIHGLQGRSSLRTVRLCELTSAIASDIESLWQTPIHVDIPQSWTPGVLAETEAVPIALVLNELILNAVKHGGKSHGDIQIRLRKGPLPDIIQVSISNSGEWRSNAHNPAALHSGLQLVEALLPRSGARLSRQQQGHQVQVLLELEPPVISLEFEESA